MDKKENEINSSINSNRNQNDGIMELNDDIVSSVVGGMAEEYALKEKGDLLGKLEQNGFNLSNKVFQ